MSRLTNLEPHVERSLCEAREQLNLSLEELLRLEDEGGNPPTKEQYRNIEALTRAIAWVDGMIPVHEVCQTHHQYSHAA